MARDLACVGDDKTRTAAPLDGDLTSLPFVAEMGPVGAATCVPLHRLHCAPVALGTMLCRVGPSLRLVVICKAAFSMESTPMDPVDAPRIHVADVHHRGRPMARVLVPSDLVPGRTRVDVTLDGHACAPVGVEMVEMAVRLTLRQQGQAVIDKPLLVMGDVDDDDEVKPFSRMPLAYERAAGGVGFDGNPIGVLDGEGSPNIVNPSQPDRPAGYGPIAKVWPARMKLLRPAHKRMLREPIMRVPEDVDWRHFQAAPLDQQIEALDPNAAIALAGMNAEEPAIAAQLPGVNAVGVAFGVDGPGFATPLSLRADSLHIHADELRCVICWRAVVEVPSVEVVSDLCIAAGVETARGRIELPSQPPPSGGSRRKPLVVPSEQVHEEGDTMAVDSMSDPRATLPFNQAFNQAKSSDDK